MVGVGNKQMIDRIAQLALENGIKLVSSEYVDATIPLVFSCPVHGEFRSEWARFKRTCKCKKCSHEKSRSRQSLNLDQVKKLVTEYGYIPNFDDYKNAHVPLDIICPNHGPIKISLTNLNSGRRCKHCSKEGVKKSLKTPFEELSKIATQKGYELLTSRDEYKSFTGIKDKFRFSCKKHGEFETSFDTFKYSNGCPKCAVHQSQAQDELYEFILAHKVDAIKNDRKTISPLEIDIYIPSLKLGIEYNGLIWHSEKFTHDKNSHFKKMKAANDKGVRLITIFADEWIEHKDNVKNFLLSAMGVNPYTVGARTLRVSEVDRKQAADFLNDNHIQGYAPHRACFGLYRGSDLLGIITGSLHHRNRDESVLVLNRLAFKNGYTISGGASKLLTALKKYAKMNGYKKIISWSDNRWSEGNVYKRMGFELAEELPPDYSYTDKLKRYPKQSNKKSLLLKRGGVGKTEKEMAESLNLYRIWDCGKKRWEINI